jgi:hypothetical protein
MHICHLQLLNLLHTFFLIFSCAASCRNNKKRKSNTSQSLSPDSVGSMSNRKMSLRLSTRLAGFSPISGPGATVDNPVIVEEAGAQTSKRGRKGRSKANASSPSIEEITSDVSPGELFFFVFVCDLI